MTGRDETADSLYRAICDDPDDVALRHVYADRLEELGDPQSEFIRVQLRLADLEPWDDDYDELSLRERELILDHGKNWAEPVAAFLADDAGGGTSPDGHVFRGGLAGCVTMSAERLIARHAEVFAAAPVTAARLLHAKWWFDDLVALPALRKLRELELPWEEDDYLEHQDAAKLAGCRHLAGLRRLSLVGQRIGDFVLLPSAPSHFAGLRTLELRNCSLFDIERLGNLRLPNLERLDLSQNAFYRPRGPVLSQAWAARLTHLSLSDNVQIGRRFTAGIAASALSPTLRSLEIRNVGIRHEGAAELASRPSLSGLVHLDVGANRIGHRGARAMFKSPHLARLRSLSVAGCEIGNPGATVLATSPLRSSLVRLDLSRNDVDDAGIAALAAGTFARLRVLRLGHNPIGLDGVDAILDGPAFAGVVRLNLSSIAADGDALCELVAGSPSAARLRDLDLSANGVGPAGVLALAYSPHLDGLARLRLVGNRHDAYSTRAICERFGRRVEL